ncbi:hypothetical protein [Clostridium paridis]|uniref:Uncharacterized protein n=1 Tax=Clostridium paridis TaxID=2803863 RepID=A0A937K612_9CLOT|nr:hypothetical protein [Clostridium paridis]MBL4933045.1 hypothetical protein [Clostridium paridis]
MYRDDYYKFTYELMPNIVYNFGPLMIYRLLRDEEKFIDNLKIEWSNIELENQELRNQPPNFIMNIVQLNFEHTAIILSIPEATMLQEAIYIAIVYDNNDTFRYFTYEICKGKQDEMGYLLREIYLSEPPTDYGFHNEIDKEVFQNKLSEIVFYDLL